MSYFYILLASVLLTFSSPTEIPHSELEKAFVANDPNGIVNLSKEKLLMTILGEEGAYAKPQAKQVLKDFFTKYPKGSFNFIFKGKEADNGSFSIANYIAKGETLRVTFHFKKVGSVFRIETLNIEK